MRVLVLHGTKGSPEGNWFPWLKQELAALRITVDVPQMPTPEGQTPNNWYTTLARANLVPDEQTIVVGHSLGGNFALHLAEMRRFRGMVLVSPVVSDGNVEEYNTLNRPFLEGGFKWEVIRGNAGCIEVLAGEDDPYLPVAPMMEAAQQIGAGAMVIPDGGHLNAESGYMSFPLVLDLVKGMMND